MEAAKKTRAALLRRSAELLEEQARIARELADLEAPAAPGEIVYTTAPGGPLPPGRSRRWLREHAGEIGAVRRGGKRGRSVVYEVTGAAYDAWLARQSIAPTSPADEQQTPVVIHVDDWIGRAGYRTTRRRA